MKSLWYLRWNRTWIPHLDFWSDSDTTFSRVTTSLHCPSTPEPNYCVISAQLAPSKIDWSLNTRGARLARCSSCKKKTTTLGINELKWLIWCLTVFFAERLSSTILPKLLLFSTFPKQDIISLPIRKKKMNVLIRPCLKKKNAMLPQPSKLFRKKTSPWDSTNRRGTTSGLLWWKEAVAGVRVELGFAQSRWGSRKTETIAVMLQTDGAVRCVSVFLAFQLHLGIELINSGAKAILWSQGDFHGGKLTWCNESWGSWARRPLCLWSDVFMMYQESQAALPWCLELRKT